MIEISLANWNVEFEWSLEHLNWIIPFVSRDCLDFGFGAGAIQYFQTPYKLPSFFSARLRLSPSHSWSITSGKHELKGACVWRTRHKISSISQNTLAHKTLHWLTTTRQRNECETHLYEKLTLLWMDRWSWWGWSGSGWVRKPRSKPLLTQVKHACFQIGICMLVCDRM